ncbi:hypothetical protein E2562_035613 [Oryza meyeriana var. granulata]|uniref:Uncharacterized protein n=1 Tax=Oryza meyeriana var. granulata TaxID=110450 RepID=A0A6G1C9I7_9ORYZ|nr:hypothetical protein E2562_035613 [Oryza meyeriana var. granulata]
MRRPPGRRGSGGDLGGGRPAWRRWLNDLPASASAREALGTKLGGNGRREGMGRGAHWHVEAAGRELGPGRCRAMEVL